MSKFKKQSTPMSLLTITKKVNANNIRFDLEVQRRSVWSLLQKQKLIDSLLFDYPVPPLYFVDKDDDFYWVLDGQQRCRAITEFFNDEFTLSDDIEIFYDEDGTEYDVQGKKYSELPKPVQTILNARNMNTYTFSNITDEQIAEIFVRLNSGSPMKKIEIVRVDVGNDVMHIINDISNTEFFKNKIAISEKAKTHFTDHEVILQTMLLLNSNDVGFSGKEIQNYVMSLKENGINEEMIKDFLNTAKYLNDVYPEKCKYLKKVNLPVIFAVANEARQNKVDKETLFGFFNDFYTEQDSTSEYSLTCAKSSAKKENVQKRLNLLKSAYDEYVKTSKEILKCHEKLYNQESEDIERAINTLKSMKEKDLNEKYKKYRKDD
jgi:hypothetical protein